MSNSALELWDLLEEASDFPDAIAFTQIWQLFDEILETLPVEQHLSIAAKVFVAMATLIDRRAEQLLKDWSDSTDPQGPTVDSEIFSGLVRANVQLDLEDLKAPTPVQTFKKKNTKQSKSSQPNDSVVAVVEKENVLAMVETIETIEQIHALAGDEDISRWQRAISNYFANSQSRSVGLTQLQQDLSMPMVEVWMGLLLGDYQLSQQGKFYETEEVRVSNPRTIVLE